MATTLREILGPRVLTGLAKTVTDGIPDTLPPGLLRTATTRGILGNTFERIRSAGTQTTARQAAWGSASRGRTISAVESNPAVLISTREHIEIKASLVQGLLDPEASSPMSTVYQRMGEQEVNRQVTECMTLINNTRFASVCSAFGIGTINFDSNGEMMDTATGAAVSVNYGIPANNLNQLNGIIGASWATAGTRIDIDLIEIQQAAVRATGRPLRHAIYGSNILGYLQGNTALSGLINNTAGINSQFARGGVAQDFFGLTWWPGFNWFARNQAGTIQQFCGADTVIFMPEIGPDWYEIIEGTDSVPTSLDVSGDALEAMRNVMPVQGKYAYAVTQTDPVGVKMIYGDNFLPHIKVPECVFIADTTP